MARLLVVFIFFMWVMTLCHAGKEKQEKGVRKKKLKDTKFTHIYSRLFPCGLI